MVEEVVWSDVAQKSFDDLISFLRKNWSDKLAEEFYHKTFDIIDLITEFPELGRLMKKGKILRQFLISKQNYMVYRIIKNNLVIVSFFDTRQASEII